VPPHGPIYARYDVADEEDLRDAVINTRAYVETLPKKAPTASGRPAAMTVDARR
jgi:hypothetical protein